MMDELTYEDVATALDRLQHGVNDKYLYFEPVPAGLGGQIAGRVHVLMLGLATWRSCIFPNLNDPPYSQIYENMSHLARPEGDARLMESLDLRPESNTRIWLKYSPLRPGELDPCDIEALLASRFEGKKLDVLKLEGFIFRWFRLLAPLAADIEFRRRNFGIGPDTLAVHFRRGDKSVETPFVPVSAFNQSIMEICSIGAFTSVFLASDSPSAGAEITAPTGVRLIFDTEERRYNNANHKMLFNHPDMSEQETASAIRNIYLLAGCGGIVGQDNAHFATLAAAAIASRGNHPERIRLIDGRIREKESELVYLYMRSSLKIRSILRTLLPFMTSQARARRHSQRRQQ